MSLFRRLRAKSKAKTEKLAPELIFPAELWEDDKVGAMLRSSGINPDDSINRLVGYKHHRRAASINVGQSDAVSA